MPRPRLYMAAQLLLDARTPLARLSRGLWLPIQHFDPGLTLPTMIETRHYLESRSFSMSITSSSVKLGRTLFPSSNPICMDPHHSIPVVDERH